MAIHDTERIEELMEERKEMLIKTGDIITFSEFQTATQGTYYSNGLSALEADVSAPEWFHLWQKRALALMRKKIPQSHLIPRNRNDYLDLKPSFWIERGTGIVHTEAHDYKQLFTEGLCHQIDFMHNEEITFNNGWLNSTNSLNIGGYSQSQTPDRVVNKLFRDLTPAAYDCFETMGWLYASLTHRLDWKDFYKGER